MNRWYTPKETVSEPEDRSLEIIQSEKQRGTKVGVKKKIEQGTENCGTISNCPIYMSWESQKEEREN